MTTNSLTDLSHEIDAAFAQGPTWDDSEPMTVRLPPLTMAELVASPRAVAAIEAIDLDALSLACVAS